MRMKTTALIAIAFASLCASFTANAAPKSSATFDQALRDAEMIANLSPDWSVHRTVGASMGDYFGDDSLIVVQKVSIEDISAGMMIVYRSAEGELISHKVVAHNGLTVTTKGAANGRVDPAPVSSDMIVGAVFCVFHSAGAPSGKVLASNGQPLPTASCKTF